MEVVWWRCAAMFHAGPFRTFDPPWIRALLDMADEYFTESGYA